MASCLRCGRPLEPLEQPFWRCVHCKRDYAEHAGRLCDRWMSPISLVLYGVLFSHRPQDDAARIADRLLADRPRDELAIIVGDIREELAHPKQRVRDILDLVASEADLREFLHKVAERIATEIFRANPPGVPT